MHASITRHPFSLVDARAALDGFFFEEQPMTLPIFLAEDDAVLRTELKEGTGFGVLESLAAQFPRPMPPRDAQEREDEIRVAADAARRTTLRRP